MPQRKENTIPVRRPRRVIRVVAWDILGNRGLASGDIRDGDVADIGRVARFFHSVKRDTRPVRRDRRKDSVSDFSLAGAIKVGEVNGTVTFESDLPFTRKRGGRRGGQGKGKEDYSFHGRTSVMKKVAASAAPITIR